MRSEYLRAAESHTTEIERLWDERGLTGRQIGEKLGLSTRAVYRVLRVKRTAPPRRSWTWFVGPKRIAAIAWLQRRRHTTNVGDLIRVTGLSRGSIRQYLKEDLNQWSDEEIAQALEQFPDPFDLGAVSAEELEGWGQVSQHETTLAVSTRRPIDVAVFSAKAPTVRLSREDQVRCALTAWHLRRERHFTTAEVAFILGRSPSTIGHCVRVLSAYTHPPLKGDYRARAAETCKQLLAAGHDIRRIATKLGRSPETVRRLLREANAVTRRAPRNDRPATPDTVASPSAELP
ncbi:helix-turn-helix domain-containing protein [Crossiella sp. CA-258035]|uniref:helix-turn-helix domain-containing protein n=1 Tax=Crossiella sp. CA-258035 TaxID=2981138 RepID=UPI0024BC6C5F|nr:helix-turn-helix domain-containing protein [Crossiella sp. CA-258035]WHT20233.1 helix-turn-helix domain-containing protein [Crossiella sp. CA-258035]